LQKVSFTHWPASAAWSLKWRFLSVFWLLKLADWLHGAWFCVRGVCGRGSVCAHLIVCVRARACERARVPLDTGSMVSSCVCVCVCVCVFV
jgi:hypothetical protein